MARWCRVLVRHRAGGGQRDSRVLRGARALRGSLVVSDVHQDVPAKCHAKVPAQFAGDWSAIMWLIANTNFGPVCFLNRVVAVYRTHPAGVWTSMPRRARLERDIVTLFRLIPLFRSPEREQLHARMDAYAHELTDADGGSRLAAVRCATLTGFLDHAPIGPRGQQFFRRVRSIARRRPTRAALPISRLTARCFVGRQGPLESDSKKRRKRSCVTASILGVAIAAIERKVAVLIIACLALESFPECIHEKDLHAMSCQVRPIDLTKELIPLLLPDDGADVVGAGFAALVDEQGQAFRCRGLLDPFFRRDAELGNPDGLARQPKLSLSPRVAGQPVDLLEKVEPLEVLRRSPRVRVPPVILAILETKSVRQISCSGQWYG